MKVGDLVRDRLYDRVGLFVQNDRQNVFIQVLWLGGYTGWIHPRDAEVICGK